MGSLRASFEGGGTELRVTVARCVWPETVPANAAPTSAVILARCRKRSMLWSKRATYARLKYQVVLFECHHQALRFQLASGRVDGDRLGRADHIFMCVHRQFFSGQVGYLR